MTAEVVRAPVSSVRKGSIINWHGDIYTVLHPVPYGVMVLSYPNGQMFLSHNAKVRVHARNLKEG